MNVPKKDLSTKRGKRIAVIVMASAFVVGGAAVGVWRLWPSPPEVVDPTDCGDWNTEDYFRNATPKEVTICLEMGAGVRDLGADGITPLFRAAWEAKNPDVIAALLSAGADVNEQLEVGDVAVTPLLMAAAGQRRGASIGVLLEAGANPTIRYPKGLTALHLATEQANWEGVSLLLQHGAPANTKDDDGRTPLNAVGERFARSWEHHGRIAHVVWTIRELLRRGGDGADLADRGWTEVHTVALTGSNPEKLSALVDQGLDPDAETSSGWRASHLAAFANEDPTIISALLELGANPNALVGDARTVDLRNELSRNPNRKQENVRIGDGRTPLHCAAFANPNPRVVAALIEGGADPNIGTTTGWTPLHAAVYTNPNPKVVRALLEGGADPNAQIKTTWTFRDLFPVSSVSIGRRDDDWDYLLSLDGNNLPSTFHGLSTPMHVAVDHPREPSVVADLIAGGADPNARDAEGKTPLHQAETVADLVSLIEAGADPNLQDETGKTPLHEAVSRISNAAYLVDDEEFGSALAGGTFSDTLTAINALLDGGADVGLSDENGVTPWDLVQEMQALKGTKTYWRLNEARFD